jgi:hypothetical protein
MRRILRTGICLLGLSALPAACGQNEGGRCQVNSDCGSGLECKGIAYGNGVCRPIGYTPDAATTADTSNDAPSSSSLDLGPDTPDFSTVDLAGLASVDSESVDAGGID